MNKEFDVVVIGAGPGGYVAAIKAAQLNLNVAIIEANHLGGICLNWGCIPTKSLLRSAEIVDLMKNLKNYGLNECDSSFEIKNIVSRSREVAKNLSNGIKHLMKKNKIEVIEGFARIKNNKTLEVDCKGIKKIISTKNIIIATGARARELDIIKPNGNNVVTYKDAMIPNEIPKSVLIVGSGAIGIEFASFYNSLGSKVTVVEVMDRILPAEDSEISLMAEKLFVAKGIDIITSAKILNFDSKANKVNISAKSNNFEISAEKIITAVGIIANTNDIGLENTKIKLEKGHIVTNEYMMTDESNIYAIGDVVAGPWLAHKASHEADVAVKKIAGLRTHPIKVENIPGCTYSHPQIASVGFSESKAKDLGYNVLVGKFPFKANGKALAYGDAEGMVKVIFDEKTGELLGAHLIGPEVTELISSLVIAKTLEATEADLMNCIFPHPTLSEAIAEAVLDAYKKVIHI